MSGIRIGANPASLRAQRKLAESSHELASVFARLSSGQRINKASDDAAGLNMATGLLSNAQVFTQAIRNVNDGLSVLNIVQGALEQLSAISMRQQELAAQAGSGTYSLAQRSAMNTEVNALVEEYRRIVQSTSFNNMHLLDGSISELRLQAGYGEGGRITFVLNEELARTVGSGSFAAGTTYATGASPNGAISADVNGDGKLDLLTTANAGNTVDVLLGNGDGTFQAAINNAVGTNPDQVIAVDLNADGKLDLAVANYTSNNISVLMGNGNGTFSAQTAYATAAGPNKSITAGDFNGDGIIDLASANTTGGCASVFIGKGDGTFGSAVTYSTGSQPYEIKSADFNGDGKLDLATANYGDGTISLLIGNGNGSFSAGSTLTTGGNLYFLQTGDFNDDGIVDLVSADISSPLSVFLGKGDGTFNSRVTYDGGALLRKLDIADFNGDGLDDIAVTNRDAGTISLLAGKPDGTFSAKIPIATGSSQLRSVCSGDFNNDGALDYATTSFDTNRFSVLLAAPTTTTIAPSLNIASREGARAAMNTLATALDHISLELGAVGSMQSRLSSVLNILSASREGYQAAAGRIMDADIAADSAQLIRVQILQNAGVAILGQANQKPALVLRLLSGSL